jgi:hypothetical protein
MSCLGVTKKGSACKNNSNCIHHIFANQKTTFRLSDQEFNIMINRDIMKVRFYENTSTKLTQIELKFVKTLGMLSNVWGYRTAPDGDHERYENKTHHSGLRALQYYTDPLFRNIQQIVDWNKSTVLPHDAYKMFEGQVNLRTMFDTARLSSMLTLLHDYIREPGIENVLMSAARYSLSKNNSLAFSAIILSIRSLLLLATSEFKAAHKNGERYIKRYNRQYRILNTEKSDLSDGSYGDE